MAEMNASYRLLGKLHGTLVRVLKYMLIALLYVTLPFDTMKRCDESDGCNEQDIVTRSA